MIELRKLLLILFIAFNGASRTLAASLEDRLILARNILKESPLIDGHNDLPYNMKVNAHNKLEAFKLDESLQDVEPWNTDSYSQTDIPRLKEGLIGAQFWVAFLLCDTQELNPVQLALEQIDVIKRMVNKYHDTFEFVTTSKGIEEAFERGKIGSLIGLEGGHMIRSSLATLRIMYELGTRYMTLTHSCNTPWASSSVVEAKDSNMDDNGLSKFGRSVVLEMNRLGMMVDLSHVSSQTMRDAIDTTLAPVIFSHSGVRAICDNPRNVPDDVLEKVKRNGGVVMVTFYDKHINCDGSSSMNDVVDHINHIRDIAGINHVGIGADYDGVSKLPKGLEDVSKYPDLLAELLKDPNWTEEDIKKLIGGNLMRVFKQVEIIRDNLRSSGVTPSEEIIPIEEQKGFTSCTYFEELEYSHLAGKNEGWSLEADAIILIYMLCISCMQMYVAR